MLSYRFLRCGIIAAVVLLGASVVYEIVNSDGCVRGSISAYFYSPVRTPFTAGLLAIGLCLIVLQGERGLEEFCLNVAGMLAPVVAFVPTKVSTACPTPGSLLSQSDESLAVTTELLASEVTEGMRNNMVVYLGVIIVVLAGLLLWPGGFVTDRTRLQRLRAAIAAYALLGLVGTWWLWNNWDGKDSSAHDVAAYTMFGFFGLVVGINALFRSETTKPYKVAYLTILGSMILAVVIIMLLVPEFRVRVFVLEAIEIGLFGLFWVLQTAQFWGDEPTAGITSSQVAVPENA